MPIAQTLKNFWKAYARGLIVPIFSLEQRVRTDTGAKDYIWERFAAKTTQLPFVQLRDEETGAELGTTLSNPRKRTAAYKAWASIRHSRSPDSSVKIMHEMGAQGVEPDVKLDSTYRGMGHSAVADGVRLDVHFNNVPMHLALLLFNLGFINSGQEKSTRFQKKFGDSELHPLDFYIDEAEHLMAADILRLNYQSLGELSRSSFQKNLSLINAAYSAYFKPESKEERSSLNVRALDTARFLLLAGNSTGFVFESSARDLGRKISHLKASPIPFYRAIASQLENLLAPRDEVERKLHFKAEAKALIRHTGPDYTTQKNLAELSAFLKQTDFSRNIRLATGFIEYIPQGTWLIGNEYTTGERMIAQYIMTLYPGSEPREVLGWIHSRDDGVKERISRIIYSGHNHHHEMLPLAKTTNLSVVLQSQIGEIRDLDRHKSIGRFIHGMPQIAGMKVSRESAEQMLAAGYGLPLYLTEIPEFQPVREQFERSLHGYYHAANEFLHRAASELGGGADYSFIMNILPLAHKQNLFMHADPQSLGYLASIRESNGNHINNQQHAFDIRQLVSRSDPALAGLASQRERIDVASRAAFFDRS